MTATAKEELEQRIVVPESASKNCATVQSDVIMLVANVYQVATQRICNCVKLQADDWSESKLHREINES